MWVLHFKLLGLCEDNTTEASFLPSSHPCTNRCICILWVLLLHLCRALSIRRLSSPFCISAIPRHPAGQPGRSKIVAVGQQEACGTCRAQSHWALPLLHLHTQLSTLELNSESTAGKGRQHQAKRHGSRGRCGLQIHSAMYLFIHQPPRG